MAPQARGQAASALGDIRHRELLSALGSRHILFFLLLRIPHISENAPYTTGFSRTEKYEKRQYLKDTVPFLCAQQNLVFRAIFGSVSDDKYLIAILKTKKTTTRFIG